MIPKYLQTRNWKAEQKIVKELDKSVEIYEKVACKYLLRYLTSIEMKKDEYLELLDNDHLLSILGISGGDEDFESKAVTTVSLKRKYHKLLVQKHKELEAYEITTLSPFFENVHRLAKSLELTDLDEEIFVLSGVFQVVRPIYDYLYAINLDLSNTRLFEMYSLMTGASVPEVTKSFSKGGMLIETKLVVINPEIAPFEEKIEIDNGFLSQLLTKYDSDEELFKLFFEQAKETDLTLNQFEHIQEDLNLCLTYLKASIANKIKGVNILIYGGPGTGKTALAGVIAKALGVKMYEVRATTPTGYPVKGKQRFAFYQTTQKTLGGSKDAIVMFDEIEDVFPQNDLFSMLMSSPKMSNEDYGKAWINKVLENNKLPTIWISNSVDQIDDAYLRRFDYSFELLSPPKAVRLRMADQYLAKGAVSPEWMEKLADYKAITPAQLASIAKVVNVIKSDDIELNNKMATQVLKNSLKLMNQNRSEMVQSVTDYSINYLNTSVDIQNIASKLNANSHCSFCFYGVPGAGKTNLAKHLASILNKPLLLKRASDIFDKYVGETEQNIARMFEQARAENAILLLDEADSFFMDRSGAKNSWEVTSVNELLTQMESFNGIFICTTNLMEKLDDASLRRFDFKIRFDYLTETQRMNLFAQEYIRQGGDIGDINDDVKNDIKQMSKLTPGDFANILRQAKVLNIKYSAKEMTKKLEEEIIAKNKSNKSVGKIGFGN